MDQLASHPVQLSLGITLRDDATFANFYSENDLHRFVTDALRRIAEGQETAPHVIWGAPGCGLTHLMQALCHEAYKHHAQIHYLPMRDIKGYSAEDLCEGLEHSAIVCLDGIDLICGDRAWEVAIFHLFNKMRDLGHTVLMGSHLSPASLPVALADLKSRILGSVIYHVPSLNDDEKQAALMMRAAGRGMHMPLEVAKYILSHSSRDMNDLFYLLHRLDEVSIQQQRRLTIPLIKEVLT